MDPEVMHFVDTMLCTDISTPVTGQLALDLMLNPPKPGDASCDAYTQVRKQHEQLTSCYNISQLSVVLFCSSKEILRTRTTLSQNAQRAQERLNDLPGMSCQPAMGGIFLYPRLWLPAEFEEQAEVRVKCYLHA